MKIMVGPKLRPARLLLSVLDAKKEVSPLRASLRPMCAPEIGILVVVVAARLALSAGIRGSFATRDILCMLAAHRSVTNIACFWWR